MRRPCRQWIRSFFLLYWPQNNIASMFENLHFLCVLQNLADFGHSKLALDLDRVEQNALEEQNSHHADVLCRWIDSHGDPATVILVVEFEWKFVIIPSTSYVMASLDRGNGDSSVAVVDAQ